MKKYCFLLSFDNRKDNYYYNQVILLIKSVRIINDSSFNNAHFFISINDKQSKKHQIEQLQKFGNVTIFQQAFNSLNWSNKQDVNKTHIKGHPNTDNGINLCRKYSIFNHLKLDEDFDRFIFLDSDFIFAKNIFYELDNLEKSVILIPSGPAARVKNYKSALNECFKIPSNSLKLASERWQHGVADKKISKQQNHSIYPHFFTGFFVLDKKSLKILKNNIFNMLDISRKAFIGQNLNTADWNFEQTAFSGLIIKENLDFDICPVGIFGPEMFHLFKNIYGSAHYLNQDVSNYKSQNCAAKNLIYKTLLDKSFDLD